MSRIYNPAIDAYYDPNSMSDVYLSKQQLAEALQAINKIIVSSYYPDS